MTAVDRAAKCQRTHEQRDGGDLLDVPAEVFRGKPSPTRARERQWEVEGKVLDSATIGDWRLEIGD